jgi:hypothetical protein
LFNIFQLISLAGASSMGHVLARWSRTPTPNVNSTIQYFGSFAEVTQEGILRVTLDGIVLNIGHNEPSAAATAPSPIKKQKFAAFAAPM